MPEFAPSETKTAIAPITVSPSGLSCEAEIFLGPNDTTKVATSGRVPFASTGAVQSVSLPVAMPATAGIYHVYIDVFAEGNRILAYQSTEDVIIAAAGPPSGELLEIEWKRYYGTDVWHPISEPIPAETEVYHRWRVRNTGNGTFYFNIGQYVIGYGEGWYYTNHPIQLGPNEESYVEDVFSSGYAKPPFSFTWYLFGNDVPLTGYQGKEYREYCDSMTVTIRVV